MMGHQSWKLETLQRLKSAFSDQISFPQPIQVVQPVREYLSTVLKTENLGEGRPSEPHLFEQTLKSIK